jgi:putative alpha-1,2-mannosidase
MKTKILIISFILVANISYSQQQEIKKAVDWVDVFIGTSNSRWMLGPYATVPFGMVQLGPDNQGDVWMGGYEYAINSVTGFSHIHAWTMGGLRMMPTSVDLVFNDRPAKTNLEFHSPVVFSFFTPDMQDRLINWIKSDVGKKRKE